MQIWTFKENFILVIGFLVLNICTASIMISGSLLWSFLNLLHYIFNWAAMGLRNILGSHREVNGGILRSFYFYAVATYALYHLTFSVFCDIFLFCDAFSLLLSSLSMVISMFLVGCWFIVLALSCFLYLCSFYMSSIGLWFLLSILCFLTNVQAFPK